MAGFNELPPEFYMALGGGIMSAPSLGQGIGQGFQNASGVMAGQREKAEAEKRLGLTYQALQKMDPEKAELFKAGVLTGPQAYSSFAEEKAKREAASKPSYKWMNIDGRLVRIDENSGQQEQMADYSTPPEPKHSADYQVFQDEQTDPGFKAAREEERRLKDAPTSKDKMDAEMDTRKTYRAEPNVKTYQTVKTAYQKGRQAAAMDSAAGDMSLVYAFMKMQDPESVVREGEYANAQNAGGVQDWVINIYNRAKDGTRLNASQKADFIKAMDEQHTIASRALEDTNRQYEPYIDEYGLPKERLITQPEKFEPLKLGQKVETTVNGKKATIERVEE